MHWLNCVEPIENNMTTALEFNVDAKQTSDLTKYCILFWKMLNQMSKLTQC